MALRTFGGTDHVLELVDTATEGEEMKKRELQFTLFRSTVWLASPHIRST